MAEGERPDDDDLGEEPSPRKIEEARKEGQVPLSQAVVLAAALL